MSGAVTIAAVEPVRVTCPLEREAMSYCFVKVTTDDGLVGWGEACDSYGCSFAGVVGAVVVDAYAPLLVGQSVDDVGVEPLAERLRLFTRRRLGDAWVAAQARSAVEIALWDLAGRAAARSVSSLVGRVRDRIAVGIDAIVDGTLAIPDAPGLGVALDESVAATNPYRPPGARVAGTRGGLPDRFTGDR